MAFAGVSDDIAKPWQAKLQGGRWPFNDVRLGCPHVEPGMRLKQLFGGQEQHRRAFTHLAIHHDQTGGHGEEQQCSPDILGTLSNASLTPASAIKHAPDSDRPRAMRSLEFVRNSPKENWPALANLPAGSPFLGRQHASFKR